MIVMVNGSWLRVEPSGSKISPQRRGDAERDQNTIPAKERIERKTERTCHLSPALSPTSRRRGRRCLLGDVTQGVALRLALPWAIIGRPYGAAMCWLRVARGGAVDAGREAGLPGRRRADSCQYESIPPGSARLKASPPALARLRPPSPTLIFRRELHE